MTIPINLDAAKLDLANVFERLDAKTVWSRHQASSRTLLGIHRDYPHGLTGYVRLITRYPELNDLLLADNPEARLEHARRKQDVLARWCAEAQTESVARLDAARWLLRTMRRLWRKDRENFDDVERLLETMLGTRNIAKAVRTKFVNPSMNQTDVAAAIHCHPSLLSASETYKAMAKEIERSAGRKSSIIRGQGGKRGQRRRPKSSEIHTENSKS